MNFVTPMNLYPNDECHCSYKFSSHWWIFIRICPITVMDVITLNFHQLMNFYDHDEFLWAWWIFIVLFILITIKNNHKLMKFLLQWSISSPRWIFITKNNSDKIDEFSSQWWILLHQWICIPMMNVITFMNFHHTYEFSS